MKLHKIMKEGKFMIKSLSVNRNISEICGMLRKEWFGDVSSKDYRDSYIINTAIERFSHEAEVLMHSTITEEDQKEPKISKSVSLRQFSDEKLRTLGQTLKINDSEVCRRILYFAIANVNQKEPTGNKKEITELKNRTRLALKQLREVEKTLNALLNEITVIEKEV